MTVAKNTENIVLSFPDHTQLPESDGTIVQNFQEHPQSILLTDSITPILQQLHPDGQYCIGQDSGIYWGLVEKVFDNLYPEGKPIDQWRQDLVVIPGNQLNIIIKEEFE
jgi:hypothetical protein